MPDDQPDRLILCGAARDAVGTRLRNAAILLSGPRIVAVDSPERVSVPDGAAVEERRNLLVIPGLVNAHAHLDLTHIGPIDYDGDFIAWIDRVRAGRRYDDQGAAASVRMGIELSLKGGTAIVGDIAGVASLAAAHALLDDPRLIGIAFLEFFGVGKRQPETIRRMREALEHWPDRPGNRLGLQPHAPYSCGLDVYHAAAQLAAEHRLALATHLAETPEELQFVEAATGPFADLLRRLGVWDDSIRGHDRHPIEHLAPALRARPWLAAHVNYADQPRLDLLAQTNVTVAYCPRASEYFGHRDHPYRGMLERGIPVALGTDSILCLDTPGRISILDEMRLLHRRDATPADVLLKMATTIGAAGLGLNPSLVTLRPGPTAGLLGLEFDPADPRDPLEQALGEPGTSMEWILPPHALTQHPAFSRPEAEA